MRIFNKDAVSILEYIILLLIIIAAFLIMKGYIQRGLHGNWQKVGDTFAFGRQYDPQKTVECGFDQNYNQWYDSDCFHFFIKQNQCGGNEDCEENIISNGVCSAGCNEIGR